MRHLGKRRLRYSKTSAIVLLYVRLSCSASCPSTVSSPSRASTSRRKPSRIGARRGVRPLGDGRHGAGDPLQAAPLLRDIEILNVINRRQGLNLAVLHQAESAGAFGAPPARRAELPQRRSDVDLVDFRLSIGEQIVAELKGALQIRLARRSGRQSRRPPLANCPGAPAGCSFALRARAPGRRSSRRDPGAGVR